MSNASNNNLIDGFDYSHNLIRVIRGLRIHSELFGLIENTIMLLFPSLH